MIGRHWKKKLKIGDKAKLFSATKWMWNDYLTILIIEETVAIKWSMWEPKLPQRNEVSRLSVLFCSVLSQWVDWPSLSYDQKKKKKKRSLAKLQSINWINELNQRLE